MGSETARTISVLHSAILIDKKAAHTEAEWDPVGDTIF